MQKILQDANFGNNMQKIRISRNLSQADVVRQLQLHGRSMSTSQYGHIEQGRKNIFVTDLILLQRIFKVDFKAFFEGIVP